MRAGSASLAWLFLRLGTTAFGGPAAHIAMMEDEVVRRRGWLTHDEFLDLLGATNLIPGPNSTEMAIHIGHRRAGWPGLLVAGVCFILPATLIVWALAWAYVRYGHRPGADALLDGVKPVVIAVVAAGALGPRADPRSSGRGLVAAAVVVAAVALLIGVHELAVLLRVRPPSWRRARRPPRPEARRRPGVPVLPLFLVFLKIGSVLFGSGYVLVAFLRTELVQRLGWLIGGAAPRRRRRGTGHARAALHHGHVRRFRPRRSRGCRWWRRSASSCRRSSSSR